ncbi:MAG TPA: putative lipid II flippase FtsW [Candidatus Hydrogenedentes bacterium]|nr:putative lipid II flippase FtsW [Candidatus Hydrogenedentota bacterium]HOS03593.1 putative lipid II flippase FtsW [Candidatus Hydrogenedentota bacterium]
MKKTSVFAINVALALVLVGVLMVYSAASVQSSDPFGELWRQLLFVAAGLLCMLIALRVDYHIFTNRLVLGAGALFVATLLVLVLLIGDEVNGARRWLSLFGFRFQPSELAKIAIIVLVSVIASENQRHIRSLFKGYAPPMIVAGAFAALVLAERDLGGPVILGMTTLMLMTMAGARWLHLFVSVVPCAGLCYWLIRSNDYRWERWQVYTRPWEYRSDEGLQLIESWAAFARGGLLGQGPGASEQKLFYLPFAHTDFIMSVLGEELGLAGTLFVVGLFAALLVLAVRIALSARDLLGTLLASGIAMCISFQAAFNMGVVTGLLPTKGLPLPFISSGGTALIVNLTLIGILLNVGIQARDEERRPAPAIVKAREPRPAISAPAR